MIQRDKFKYTMEQNRILTNINDKVSGEFEETCYAYMRKNKTMKLPETYECFKTKLKEFKDNLWNKLYDYPSSVRTDEEAASHLANLALLYNVLVNDREFNIEDLSGKYKDMAEDAFGLILECGFVPKDIQ